MLRTAFFAGVLSCTVAWPQSTNYIVSAGYTFPGDTPVSPGRVITLFVRGLNVPDAVAQTVPLPTVLAGITVAVKKSPHARISNNASNLQCSFRSHGLRRRARSILQHDRRYRADSL